MALEPVEERLDWQCWRGRATDPAWYGVRLVHVVEKTVWLLGYVEEVSKAGLWRLLLSTPCTRRHASAFYDERIWISGGQTAGWFSTYAVSGKAWTKDVTVRRAEGLPGSRPEEAFGEAPRGACHSRTPAYCPR